MEFLSVEGNTQRLDGGAMFGNCPRALWQRWCEPDAQNRLGFACRSLLVREDDGRLVLLETGIGAFFEPKLRERYGVVESHHVLLESLAEHGIAPGDIDVIVLSHLHFDHAGGLLQPWAEGASPQLAFEQAHFVVSRDGWDRARNPHPRDRASFIPELPGLLEGTGRLEIVEAGKTSQTLGDRYTFTMSEGHTPGLMLTRVQGPDAAGTFLGDLVPGVPWVHLPITMGYDRFPERLIDEKTALLTQLAERDEWVFFTHDAKVAAAKLEVDPKGRMTTRDEQATLRLEA